MRKAEKVKLTYTTRKIWRSKSGKRLLKYCSVKKGFSLYCMIRLSLPDQLLQRSVGMALVCQLPEMVALMTRCISSTTTGVWE